MWEGIYCNQQFWQAFQEIMRQGKHRVSAGGRVEVIRNRKTQGITFPWYFLEQRGGRSCSHWLKICFDHFGIIPEYCRNHCFKVMIKPKTVESLINGTMPAMVSTGFWGKCGIDLRRYTDNLYLGAFYAETFDEGAEILTTIRKLLPNENIILKRMCTEMEAKYPKLPEDTSAWDDIERRLNDMFHVVPDPVVRQASWIKNGIVYNWLKYARSNGDMTYKNVVGDIFPSVKSKTYEPDN